MKNPVVFINRERILFDRSIMIYGHFLEHFHRQIYGGVYDPGSRFADEDGFRTDVIEALKQIKTPVIRWPGGCFVSSYRWEKGVGNERTPYFDKAWRVEDSNSFGTDEFVKLCGKIGCEPYICTNAGTGTEEESGNWMEYCNLKNEGEFAKKRINNGFPEPHNVKFWSVGNENYGGWEIGAKGAAEWGRFVAESAKILKHIDPSCSLSAAANTDLDWNINLLKTSNQYLDWISVHSYWDAVGEENRLSSYEKCMAYTSRTGSSIKNIRGILTAMGLENRIKIAFDEWNLRSWYHPKTHTIEQGLTMEDYLIPRNKNDDNSSYTMADAVFSACFLNECLRNADIVGMANFAPAVNTRGAIFTHDDGIVKRSTYHVFHMFANLVGDRIIDSWVKDGEKYKAENEEVDCLDIAAALDSSSGNITVSAVNKHDSQSKKLTVNSGEYGNVTVTTLSGGSRDDYNDIGRELVKPYNNTAVYPLDNSSFAAELPAHSVNIITFSPECN